MNKNVLVLTNNIGGLHSFRKEVMKAILDSGYKVTISYPDFDERASYFEGIGCKMVHTPFNRRGMNPIKDLSLLMTYIKLIQMVKPIVVLTYTIKSNIYGGIACRFCKVHQLANVTGLGDAIENGGLLSKIALGLYRFGIKKAKVFFQNSANRTFCIKQGIVSEDAILLPGSGVNLLYHTYQEYPKDNDTKFLFIARLLKDKGTMEYFEMAKYIRDKYPQTEFQILGPCEGNFEKELGCLVENKYINYLGTTSDVRPYIASAHCTVMPSYHEGLSNVNLESSANGRPVITTNVSGCRETVDDGITGFTCDAKSVDALKEAVEKFINLPYEEKKKMGVAARNKVEREFSRQIVVDVYLNEINRISIEQNYDNT